MIYDIKKYNSDKLSEEEITTYNKGDITLLFDMEFDEFGNVMHIKVVFSNENIKLYILDKYKEAYVLNAVYKLTESQINYDEVVLSDVISKATNQDLEGSQAQMYGFLLSYGLALLSAISDKNAKKKTVKTAGYEKVKISKYELEYRVYDKELGFDVIKKDKGITVILASKGEIYTLPSKLYHLPAEKTDIYTSDDTECIDDIDEINSIMSDVILVPGNALEAADIIMKKLQDAGYTDNHKCEYKYGWLFWEKAKAPFWHAFVLIENKYILDSHLPAFKINEKYINKCSAGEINSMPADTAISLEIENICKSRASFTDKYGCGKLSDDCIILAADGDFETAKKLKP